MLTAKQMLDKIKWSKKFDQDNITISYFDRKLNENIALNYKEAIIEDNFIIIKKGNNLSEIPLHRLREIRNKGIIIWKRDGL